MLGTFSKVMKSTVLYQIDNYDITTNDLIYRTDNNTSVSVHLGIYSICNMLYVSFCLNYFRMEEGGLN